MRQRTAITAFAKAHGYRIVDEFYDAAVSGADPVTERPGFRAMLDRIAGDGVRVILVESPDRFAGGGVFSEEVRRGRRDQLDLLGAIPQFEKASLIGKGSGRKTLAEARPETVALAKQLHAQGLSLRRISAELASRGHVTSNGRPYVASHLQQVLKREGSP